MPRLSTFADFVRLHYGLACDCQKCGRSVRLNVAALIMRGKGDRRVHRTRPVCRSCGDVGTYRILQPEPPAPRSPPANDQAGPNQRGGIFSTPSQGPSKPPRSRLIALL